MKFLQKRTTLVLLFAIVSTTSLLANFSNTKPKLKAINSVKKPIKKNEVQMYCVATMQSVQTPPENPGGTPTTWYCRSTRCSSESTAAAYNLAQGDVTNCVVWHIQHPNVH